MNTLTIEVPPGDTCDKCKFFGYYSYSNNGNGHSCELFDTDINYQQEKCLACRLLSRNDQTNKSEELDKVEVTTESKEPCIRVKDINELLMSKYDEYFRKSFVNIEPDKDNSAEEIRWQTVREIFDAVNELKRV